MIFPNLTRLSLWLSSGLASGNGEGGNLYLTVTELQDILSDPLNLKLEQGKAILRA